MGVSAGPNIIRDSSLVLDLDAFDQVSLPSDPTINLQPYSQTFIAPVYWVINDVTPTSGSYLAPDGTNTAVLLTENTNNAIHRIYSNNVWQYYAPNTFVTGAYYNISFYIKSNGRAKGASFWEWPSGRVGVTYDLNSGSISEYITGTNRLLTSSISNVGNGWYRISYASTDTASLSGINTMVRLYDDAGIGTYTGNGLSGSYVWGAQIERGTYATPYLPTTTYTASRNTWYDTSPSNYQFNLTYDSTSGSIPAFNSLNQRILNFDGTSSYAKVNSVSFNCSPITVAIYYKKATLNQTMGLFFGDANWGNGGRSHRILGDAIQLYSDNGTVTTISNASFVNALSTLNWTQICYTVTGSIVNVYANGVNYIRDYALTSSMNTSSAFPIQLGKLISGTTDFYFSGSIGSVLIYNRVLSDSEVSQNYNAIKTRYR